MGFVWPEQPAEEYIPRGMFVPDIGYFSSFDDETAQAPIYVNVMCDVESTWINRAYFEIVRDGGWTKHGNFYVEFLSLAQVVYPSVPVTDWIDFVRSGSHGLWLYMTYHQTGRDYELLREAKQVVTADDRKKRDIGVQELEDRPTVRNYLGKKATDRLRSLAYNPGRR